MLQVSLTADEDHTAVFTVPPPPPCDPCRDAENENEGNEGNADHNALSSDSNNQYLQCPNFEAQLLDTQLLNKTPLSAT